MNNLSYILILFLLLTASSCNNSNTSEQEESSESSLDTKRNSQIKLSSQQVTNADIKTCFPTLDTLSQNVQANGMIQLPPNSKVSINAPFESFIDKIYHLEGQQVKKGQILVALKHPTFIQMQQEYQQAVSQLNFLEQELDRQKTLSEANVSAKKKYQQTRADFDKMSAQRNALAQKLKMIGIEPSSIAKGSMQSIVYLRAPFSGKVANVKAFKGQSVMPQQSILEILNPKDALLELKVFEKHINKIAAEQALTFTVSSFSNSPVYSAKITSVGTSLDLTSRTITVIAKYSHQPELIPGLYVEVIINANPESYYTVPEEALIRDKDSTFVFIEKSEIKNYEQDKAILFDKIPVEVLRTDQGKIAITLNDRIHKNSKIVMSGANYLKSEMSKGEGDDD